MTVRSNESRRERQDKAVRENIDGVMTDTRYDRLRGRGTRRALVVVYLSLLVALLPAYLAGSAIGGTAVMVLGVVVLAVLRVATRVVADAPPELLDERQRALQGRAYLGAYRVVSSVTILAGTVAFVLVLLSPEPETFPVLVGLDAVSGLVLTLIGLTLAAPTCIVAWEQEHV